MTNQARQHLVPLLNVIKQANPQKVILFGSATTPHWDPNHSDLDLCLIKPTNQPIYKEKAAIWKLLSQNHYQFPTDIDLHIYPPEKASPQDSSHNTYYQVAKQFRSPLSQKEAEENAYT